VVTHQLQVERRTGKVRQSETDVLPLCHATNLIIIIIIILTPVLKFPGNGKITLYNTKKYENPAGMNLTPPPPSQNSHAVRWHCTAESERRVAGLLLLLLFRDCCIIFGALSFPGRRNYMHIYSLFR